jgi:hypothetical protein
VPESRHHCLRHPLQVHVAGLNIDTKMAVFKTNVGSLRMLLTG